MIELRSIYRERDAVNFLYELLKERTPEQSISHRAMPTLEEHAQFVRSKPYFAWYLIMVGDEWAGTCYLTHDSEIGIHIKDGYRGNGYGAQAVSALMTKWPRKRYLANINPANAPSIAFFEKLGARHIQSTFEL